MNHENTKERKHESSKYFWCEAHGIQLYKPICINWQKQAKKATTPKLKKKWAHCIDCEQGRKIAEELKNESRKHESTKTRNNKT